MDFNVLVQKSYSKPSKNTNFGVKDGGDRNLELLQNIIYNAPVQPQIARQAGKQKRVTHTQNKKLSIKIVHECHKMLHITDKDFKTVITKLFFKKTIMFEEWKYVGAWVV